MNIKLDPARRLARKKAMTGCGIGSSAQRRVHLDPSFQALLRIAVRHGLANLLSHPPGGRITDFDLLAQLHRRDSLTVRMCFLFNCFDVLCMAPLYRLLFA
jgi:hypothetical protein